MLFFTYKSMQRITVTLASIVLIGIAFFTGLQVGTHQETDASTLPNISFTRSTPPEGVDFSPLWKAWHLLDEKYVPAGTSTDVLSDDEKLWGAIQGLARAYGDPYTVFLPPAENEMFNEEISGEFGGVGMEIGRRDNMLMVIAPLRGTPAESAGVLAGDYIIEIEGESTENMTVDSAVKIIRGEPGTTVSMRLAREGASSFIDVSIVRDHIKIPTIETELRKDDIFVIELYNFGQTSPSYFRNAMREFVLSGSDKLVIDLRGNPGGYLEASIDIASWFLPMGKTVVRESYGDGAKEIVHRSKGYNVYKPNWDVVVLIDQGSASASEIVAGALSEHSIATLIGEQSFGKGSVQELVPVTPQTSLKVTIARWLTPNGVSISENGLTPDIVVPYTLEDREAERDPQFDRAIEFLTKGE